MARSRQSKNERRRRFEQFEERLVMSAQALMPAPDVAQLVEEIAPLVEDSALTSSGEESAAGSAGHGFDGSGQTIAIIDSGIAWDHAALGNGYGSGNKVVGGWDFAENDSNPYDDGPAGFHGTHVAGIAAGDGENFQGVAPGADLVGLRVFNDQGVGKIEWVESALQWVRNNLDSFSNPITTVNMSLGADWNTESVSDWNVIEDELADLKSEGVFISVAAGNDFEDFFGSKTLSYPAASDSVVPVASSNADNQLSDFSQRDDHVLVAPGENIDSTVPNHLFGSRYSDQLLGASGTSMAAPYVAGASAVLRQAYGAMGYGEVNQDTLYETFWNTSNEIYDSVTQTTFRQLNLNAAIESISNATNNEITQIGAISGGEVIRGTLSSRVDVDSYEFHATQDGQVELTFEATEALQPGITILDDNGAEVRLHLDDDRAYVNVAAGQSYTLSVSSEFGEGHYQISAQFQVAQSSVDLGTIESIAVKDFIAGDRTFSITASRSGPMAFGLAADSPSATIEVYDASMNRLTSQRVIDGRVDFHFEVTEGESLFVLVKADGEVELSVENLIELENNSITVYGTEQADSFVVNDASDTFHIEINGTKYSFSHAKINSVSIIGDSTHDSATLQLSDRFNRTVLRQNRVDAFDGTTTLRAISMKNIDVSGSGQLTVAGSNRNDSITGNFESMTISDGVSRATGHGFERMIADGKGGQNSIQLSGNAGDDIFFTKNNYSSIRNDSTNLIAIQYDSLDVDGGGGYDIVNLFGDSERTDSYELGVDSVQVNNGLNNVVASGFERASAFAGNAADTIIFTDSEGNDHFMFADGTTQLVSDSARLVAHDFLQIEVRADAGGHDVAQISGSDGTDILNASQYETTFSTEHVSVSLNLFERINVVADFESADQASFTGTSGSDQFHANETSATTVFAGGSIVRTVGIGDVTFDGNGGHDLSFLRGSTGADTFEANNQRSVFRAGNIKSIIRGVEATELDGQGGGDSVFIDDVAQLDVIAALGDKAVAILENHQIDAEAFDFLEATAVDDVISTYDMERVDFQTVLRGAWKPR